MPKIDELTIRRIKDVARIEDVVSDFVTLRRQGVNMTGLCPFHDDQHDGNFIVRPSTVSGKRGGNTYHCFVCMGKKDGGGPVDFLMKCPKSRMTYPDAIRYLGRKYSIETDNVPVNFTPPPPKPPPPPLPLLRFKRDTVKETIQGIEQTVLVRWLYTLPWTDEQRARLWQVLRMYCVAVCPNGLDWIRFWQISHEGVPLTAKWMKYKADGHRVKDKRPDGSKQYASDWEHAWRARQGQYNRDKYDVQYALFGAHLLKRYPDAVVNVVESEKSALIMATYYGQPEQNLWVACGGLNWIDLDIFQPLIDQGRTVWLWPDRDGVEKWQQVCDKLGADNVRVYTDFFRTSYVPEDDGPKADIADIAIRLMGGGRLPEQHNEQNHTGDPQPPTNSLGGGSAAATPDPSAGERPDGVSDEEWLEHTAIMKAIREWNLTHVPDEPFPGNTPLQQLLHDRVEESKRKRKEKQKNEQQQQSDRQG
ncbi:MAG: hypothetical protein IJ588_02470 [Prevotella sp.]|nr:hypothetical protein [Prevotella sp.]